ncbi:hypothetical protein RRF57_002416 [Xylaria bambusicola]|uniref:Alpha-aminoadipate reductase n=1 Tax=Xylaria bambusicola TaxID=326684 RepID=A0AAN7UIP9_9PEZI
MANLPNPTVDLNWTNFRGGMISRHQYDTISIHEIFAKNAKQFPARPCVIETKSAQRPQRSFSYGQINEASNQLAHHLVANGAKVGDVVTIYAYRGVDLVVAYMGALKAGLTVSVLDPQYPPDRQITLLSVLKPDFLISIQRTLDEFGKLSDNVSDYIKNDLEIKSTVPALELQNDGSLKGGDVAGQDCLAAQASLREESPDVTVGPDSAPTLSCTSGSRFSMSEADRFTMLSGIAHDPIQRDIFTPLYLGASLWVPPVDVITYGLLAEWMHENKVTITHLTPAMGQILVGGATTQFPSLRRAYFVGDQLTKKDLRRLQDLAQNAAVINLYGSTESQRSVSFFEVPSKTDNSIFLDTMPDVIPVGQGMLDVQLLVVNQDDRTKLCAIGEQGELYIRAGGLAEGYRGDDEKIRELNRSKFVPNWFIDPATWVERYSYQSTPDNLYKGPRDRLYRTGDLGRVRQDGSVECTGRIDSQVKIRGFRIELGEIDATLSQHPYVRENVTIVRRDKNEEQTLVTYFVPETRRWFDHLEPQNGEAMEQEIASETMAGMLRRFKQLSDDCKQFLAKRLPNYAVPQLLIPLTRFPLNPNGKIDRPALPFPEEADLMSVAKRRASSVVVSMTETQTRLAKVWAKILPNRSARMFVPESNFFEEGGHSVLAQQLFFSIRSEWKDIDMPVTVIFRSQTLAALAAEIDRASDPIGLRLDAMPLPGDAGTEDEAYAADAKDLASQLPESFPSVSKDWDYAKGSPTVFLTGATGFLGSYILHELLEGPAHASVIAHVRAKDAASGHARIESVTKAYGLWSPCWQSRLSVVVGDITKPSLGVSQDSWDRLSQEVDIIIHNGAQVNWMLPYSSMRAANVLSTLDCIRLCGADRAKRLVFISSTSTLESPEYHGVKISEKDDLEASSKTLSAGYGQSKWASEYLVRESGRRGLVGAVVRPGYVLGDPASGISVSDDFLVRLWKGCLQVGARPDIGNDINMVPVNRVARIVVAAGLHLATATDLNLGVAQVTSRDPRLTVNQWIGALESYGYRLPMVPYQDWRNKVTGYVNDGSREEYSLLPLFSLVMNLPANTVAPVLDDSQAMAALELYDANKNSTLDSDNESINVRSIGMYLAYLVAIGFLPSPTENGENELPSVDGKKIKTIMDSMGGRSAKR